MAHERAGGIADGIRTAATVAFGVASSTTFLCMPVVVSTLASERGLTDPQVGQFSAVQMLFAGLGSFATLWIGRRINLRALVGIVLPVLALADLITPFVSGFAALLIVRAIGGFAGGVVVASVAATLARSPNPERNFGWFFLSQILFQMAALSQLPKLVAVSGVTGLFLTLGGLELGIALFLVLLFPSVRLTPTDAAGQTNTRRLWMLCGIVLVSIFCYGAALGSFWTFVGRIGQLRIGLTSAQIGSGLGAAAFGGVAGALLPIFAGNRIGSTAPVVGSSAGLLCGLILMRAGTDLTMYTLAAGLFSFGWYVLNPYQMGILAAIDRDGRALLAVTLAGSGGIAVGPVIAGMFIPSLGILVSISVSLVCTTLALVLILFVIIANDMERR